MEMATICEMWYTYCQPSDSLDFYLPFFTTQKWFISVQLKMSSFFFHTH